MKLAKLKKKPENNLQKVKFNINSINGSVAPQAEDIIYENCYI